MYNPFVETSLTVEQRKRFQDVIPEHLTDLIEFGLDLDQLDFNQSQKYYLYTGRGPSSGSFHIGHLSSYELTLALQKTLKEKIFFMLSDDETIFKGDISFTEVALNVSSTLDQLQSLGFNHNNTHFHLDSHGLSQKHYEIVTRLLRLVNTNQLEQLFGKKQNLGEYFYPLVQIFPCFLDKKNNVLL
jgi:tryptophanyl-tRNA synthetase